MNTSNKINQIKYVRDISDIIVPKYGNIPYVKATQDRKMTINKIRGNELMKLMCPRCYGLRDFEVRHNSITSGLYVTDKDDETHDINITVNHTYYGKCTNCNTSVLYIELDYNISRCIELLNKKGYRTKYCCEGHDTKEYTSKAYIYFKDRSIMKYFYSLPFTWYFDTLDFKRSSQIIIRSEGDAWNSERIEELYDWVDSLPIR